MKLNSQYSMPDVVRLAWSLFLTWLFFPPARLIRQPCRIRGYGNMRIGKGFTTGQYCRIEAASRPDKQKSLSIGNSVQINDRCHIAAIESVEIGDDVLIASNVFISDHDHGDTSLASLKTPPAIRPLVSSSVKIERNVWIGENVVILRGVTIGESSVIAAGAVVTRDIPPYCVAAGVPAKVFKQVSHL